MATTSGRHARVTRRTFSIRTSRRQWSAPALNFVTERPEAGRRFIRAYLQGVRDYNDALKGDRIAGPDAEDVVDAIAR